MKGRKTTQLKAITNRTGKIIAIAYFVVLLYITIISRLTDTYPFQVIAGVNWKLFNVFRESSHNDIVYSQTWLIDFLGNILLFVPFIPCARQLIKVNSLLIYIILAFVTSIIIEFAQYTFSIGLASVDDVLLNMAGAYVGHVLYPYLIKFYNELD